MTRGPNCKKVATLRDVYISEGSIEQRVARGDYGYISGRSYSYQHTRYQRSTANRVLYSSFPHHIPTSVRIMVRHLTLIGLFVLRSVSMAEIFTLTLGDIDQYSATLVYNQNCFNTLSCSLTIYRPLRQL